jgi:hypothetical protein
MVRPRDPKSIQTGKQGSSLLVGHSHNILFRSERDSLCFDRAISVRRWGSCSSARCPCRVVKKALEGFKPVESGLLPSYPNLARLPTTAFTSGPSLQTTHEWIIETCKSYGCSRARNHILSNSSSEIGIPIIAFCQISSLSKLSFAGEFTLSKSSSNENEVCSRK